MDRFPFFVKEKIHPSIHLAISTWKYTRLQDSSKNSLKSSNFHTSAGISSNLTDFPYDIFCVAFITSYFVNGLVFISSLFRILVEFSLCIVDWILLHISSLK